MVSFDDIVAEVGSYGRYQVILTIIACSIIIPSAFNTNLPLFILNEPKHRCMLDNYPNDTYAVQSPYHRHLINISIPDDDGKMSKCEIYRNITNADSVPKNISGKVEVDCDRWVYDKTYFDRTVTEEINLVCDRNTWRDHANMAMMVGKFVSALVQGVCSDIFGRRKTLLAFIIIAVTTLFLNAFIFNFPFLIAIRFLSGLATASTYMNVFIIVLEFLGPQHRNTFNVVQGYVWLGGALLLDGLAYGIRDFEYLCLALAVPSLIYLSAFCLIPESPRWLLSKGRYEEARDIVVRMCHRNGKPFPTEIFDTLVKEMEEEREAKRLEDEEKKRKKEERKGGNAALGFIEKAPENLITYLRHKKLTVLFVILMWNWITNSLVYYAIFFDVPNLSGSIYLNFLYGSFVDILGNTLSYFLVDRLGRKITYQAHLALSSVACLCTIFPLLYASENVNNITIIVLSNVGRFGIGTAYNILYLYCGEIYPTTIRNTAMGVSSMISRIGSISATYIADLGKNMGGAMTSAFPLIVIGAVGLTATVSSFFLPETNGRDMPATIEDAVQYQRKRRPLNESKITLAPFENEDEDLGPSTSGEGQIQAHI